MSIKLGCTVIAGGVLVGLTGCSISLSDTSGVQSAPQPTNTQNQPTNQNPTGNNANQGTTQNATPSTNTGQSTTATPNTQTAGTNVQANANVNPNTQTTTQTTGTQVPAQNTPNTANAQVQPNTNQGSNANAQPSISTQPGERVVSIGNQAATKPTAVPSQGGTEVTAVNKPATKPTTNTQTPAQGSIPNTPANPSANTNTTPNTNVNTNTQPNTNQGTNTNAQPSISTQPGEILVSTGNTQEKPPTIAQPISTSQGSNQPPTPNTPATPSTGTSATPNPNASTNVQPPQDTGNNLVAITLTPDHTANFAFSVPTADKNAWDISHVTRPSAELEAKVQEVLDNTNSLRIKNGLKPLKLDPTLTAYAQVRASEIIHVWAHKRMDNKTDIGNLGENIAQGASTGDEVVNDLWFNSPRHRENMLNATYETIGIGVVADPNNPNRYYWVQLFNADIYNGKNFKAPYEFTSTAQSTNESPLEHLVIDGKTIPLDLGAEGEWQALTKDAQGWVNGYQHTRFGVVTPSGANVSQLYYQGHRTNDTAIPKSGTANYKGTALVVKGTAVNTDVKSEFTADFGTRKLTGTLSQNNVKLYDITADINGGAFASAKGASVQTQGAFFGSKAEEMAGVFKDTKSDTKGVFGAKKQ